MCGSGPHERDENGKIDFEKETRTGTVEVLDLLDPNFKKVIHTNFPLRNDCFGGILNNTPFFGGGEGGDKDVFVLDKSKTKMKLKEARYGAACAKMKDDVYWIFGGINEEGNSLNSTEVVVYESSDNSWSVHESATLDRDSNHCDMDFQIYGHCVVNFDDQHMFLIGGVTGGNYDPDLDEEDQEEAKVQRSTWFIDMEGFFSLVKPFRIMSKKRKYCQAAVMCSRGRRVIVVAGGHSDRETLDSVDIIDPWNQGPEGQGWTPGKEVYLM